MGFLKKLVKKGKKLVKKVGKGLKKGVKKLATNIKKHGPEMLAIASMFIPGGVGGLLGKAGGAIGKIAPKLGGFMGGLGNLGHGTGLFGKAGGFLSGQGGLSAIFGGTGGQGFSNHPLMQMFQGGGEGGGGQAGGLLSFLDPSGDGLFGDFSRVYFATFGPTNILVDPYSRAAHNEVRLVLNNHFDFAVADGASFVKYTSLSA